MPAAAIIALFTALASGLSEANPPGFMAPFDPAMPGYQQLRAEVTALVEQSEVLASIDFLKDEGGETSRVVEMDWFLELTLRYSRDVERRRERVTARVERKGKEWRITSFQPVELFRPQKVAAPAPP